MLSWGGGYRALTRLSHRGLSQKTITEGLSFQFETLQAQDKKLYSTLDLRTQPKARMLGPFHPASVGRERHSCREEGNCYRGSQLNFL